jgi:hypothetical protein
MTWRIYYSDGLTFDSSQGEPCEAPAWGVIVIAQSNDLVGRQLVHQKDYYWWEDAWFGGNIIGLVDYLTRTECGIVRMGRTITNNQYRGLVQRAAEEQNDLLPVKSGWLQSEKI